MRMGQTCSVFPQFNAYYYTPIDQVFTKLWPRSKNEGVNVTKYLSPSLFASRKTKKKTACCCVFVFSKVNKVLWAVKRILRNKLWKPWIQRVCRARKGLTPQFTLKKIAFQKWMWFLCHLKMYAILEKRFFQLSYFSKHEFVEYCARRVHNIKT